MPLNSVRHARGQGRASRGVATPVVVLVVGLAALIGALIGIGVFTFGYAQGLSYLSDDPTACTNCHVMNEYFDSWQQSSHHHVAACNDCHLAGGVASRYLVKTDNGFFHSLAFTLDNFDEPIQIKERNRIVTQKRCIACHADLVDHMRPAEPDGELQSCVHCHADVGHGLE